MTTLKQYIDIFNNNVEMLNSGSCDVMNSLRKGASETLKNATLPKKGSEDYEHCDLTAILSPDYGLNIARVPMKVNPALSFKCDVPNMSTALFFLINDSFASTDNSYNKLPDNAYIGSLKKIASQHPEIISKYYGTVAEMSNLLVALNTMLAQDGFVIYVPKGVKVEKPIQLVNILQSEMPLMVCRRILIILEENAEAQLLMCDHTQNNSHEYLNLQTIEIIAKRGAKFDIYDLEESSVKTNRLSSLYLHQEEDSNVLIDGITLFNGHTRNEYVCTFKGEHSELQLLGMGIEDDMRTLDTYSLIRHNVKNCHSNELFKYVLDDHATGSFSGRIYVAPYATNTTAYQANRNVVGSESAKMHSKPQLEIYNDDVKCSHGTAIGQLDEQQLFYMRTRGLSEEIAKTLLKQAFMSDVIDGVRLPALKDRLRMLVENRFSGGKSGCASCSADCHIENLEKND